MAFMMTATLVPASHVDAASRNAVNRTASATSSSLIDETSGVALSLAKDGGGVSIKGAKKWRLLRTSLRWRRKMDI